MKKKILSHSQLVAFTVLVPLAIILVELLPVFIFSLKKDLFLFALITAQYIGLWLIYFLIYQYAYEIVCFSDKGIADKSHRLSWENICRFRINSVEIRRPLTKTIGFDSMVYFIGSNNEEIGFSMSQKNLEKISSYVHKSQVLYDFIEKYKDKNSKKHINN